MKKKRTMLRFSRGGMAKFLLKMKLLTVFMLSVFAVSAGNSYSQQTKFNLKLNDVTVREVFQQIEKNSEFILLYNEKVVDVNRKVDVKVKNETVESVLAQVFEGTKNAYKIYNRQIVILENENAEIPSILKSWVEQPQKKEISGTVSDKDGQPIPGVSVLVRRTTTGTVTDFEGNFNLEIPIEAQALQFSFVGMETQEISIVGKTQIFVVMVEDLEGIEEVIVVGYGTQKKVNLTGAVSVVKGEELVNKPIVGTMEALQGTMSGTVITRTSGSPGDENFNIQIRGLTSVNSAPALILVDGIEGDINDVRPEDIESISVLKDASSAAIYGAKAAGGVVLITTKSGKAGKVVIEYNGYYSLSTIGRTGEGVSSLRAAEMRNEADINAGGSAPVNAENLAKLADPDYLWDEDPKRPNHYRFFGDYNYMDIILKKYTPLQSHNIAISGGSEKTKFRLSGTYFENDGMIKIGYDKNTKYSSRLNLVTDLNKYMNLSNNFSYSHNTVEKPVGNIEGRWSFIASLIQNPGATPYRDPNGNLTRGEKLGKFDTRQKFYDYSREKGKNSRNNDNLRLNSVLTIGNFVKGLKFRLLGAINANLSNWQVQMKKINQYGIDGSIIGGLSWQNAVTKGTKTSVFREFQFLADYDIEINNHSLTVLGGYSAQDFRSDSFWGSSGRLVNGNLPSFNWGDRDYTSLNDKIATYAYQSLFGRLAYNFKGRYLFETNFRYDGSSKLSPENRYKFFPSASAGWRISEESWFTPALINEFKVRGSWGQLGNAGVLGNYDYIPLLKRKDDIILNGAQSPYVYQNTLASNSISWEIIETSNIGLDLNLFESRFSMTFDYFKKVNKDMLSRVNYPSLIGVGVPNQNAGSMKSWGWETTIGWKEQRGSWKYWINVNLSNSQNELTDYLGANVIKPGLNRLIVGYPVNSIFGYKSEDQYFKTQEEVDAHAFQNNRTGPGDTKYIDLNGDGKVNSGRQSQEDHGDLVYLGNTNPEYSFGTQMGFVWKSLDFSLFLQGVGSRKFLLSSFQLMAFPRPWMGPLTAHEDYWTEDNQDAFFPRLYMKGAHNYLPSEKWVQDAAYIRVKDIQVGYTMPYNMVSKIGIEKLRLYISGHDIFEITKTFSFVDPEFPDGSGGSAYKYPFRRRLTLGMNLTF